MNNIETITARIAAQAQEEIAQLDRQTEQEIQQILDHCAAQAETEYDQVLSEGQAAAAAHLEQMDSMDALEARKLVLAKKRELVAETFDLVLQQLCAMEGAERASLLAQLAVNGCTTGTEELVLSTDDREDIGEGVVEAANILLEQTGRTGQLTLSDDTRSTQGGLFIRAGKVETNCSYETLLRLAQENYASDVAGILFV
mgnify:CR=1 FL=1